MKIKAHYNGNITITNFQKPFMRNKIKLSDRTKKRVFKLSYSKYRQLAGNSAKMFESKKNQILFLTFTIKDNITDTSETNKAWSYFLHLMRYRHGLNNYLWVAERQKRGAVHYHCLLDMPYIPYKEIKEIYYNCFAKHRIKVSKENSISASKNHGAIVKNVNMALKYITKYISKDINKTVKVAFSGRNYAFSNEINVKPIQITYDDLISIQHTTMSEYNFKYCSVLICDLETVIELFRKYEYRKRIDKHLFYFDISKKMPSFDVINDLSIYIKPYLND